MRINLRKDFFPGSDLDLLVYGNMKITAFKFPSGVEALTVENTKGYFTILPFKGQQIWELHFNGQDFSMQTTIKQPVPTPNLLDSYGGFLYHCGVTACGVPQADDDHPQHGELHNITYDNAYIRCDEDEKGKYIAVGGDVEYNVAFKYHYIFSPEVRLYENDTKIIITISLENKRNTPFEYMYLCHINYRPIDGAELIYSAPYDKEHITVHKIISPTTPGEKAEKLLNYMNRVQETPELHHKIGDTEALFDPEICMTVRYKADEKGRAYTMQYKKGEGACFVDHPLADLPLSTRWIARTDNEDAMGMILPATSEHLGRNYAKRKGTMKVLAPHEKTVFTIETGWLSDADASALADKIEKINK